MKTENRNKIRDYVIIGLATLLGFTAGVGLSYTHFKNKMKENQGYHFHATPIEDDHNTSPSSFDDNATDPSKQTDYEAENTKILFTDNAFDFGQIREGDVVNTVFEFTNTGNKDLIIKNCVGSCGCTVPKWPKEAIKPGKKGNISVQFNSAGKRYKQKKTVTVVANTDPSNQILYIYADVVAKK